MSQANLASKVGAHWVTVSKLERGVQKLTQEWIHKLSAALLVEPYQIIEPEIRSAPDISGFIGRGGWYDRADNEDDILEGILLNQSKDIKNKYELQLWCLLTCDEFFPFMRKGDLIRFTFAEWVTPRVCENRLSMVIHRDNAISAAVGFLRFMGNGTNVIIDRPANEPLDLPSFSALGVATVAEFRAGDAVQIEPRGLFIPPPNLT